MNNILILTSIIIFTCILLDKISYNLGIPMLIAFIFLGILFGVDGIFKIQFDDFSFVENICIFALIFIMFYGGFGTRWKYAKFIALQASLMSSLGVILTTFFTGLFCRYILGFDFLESFLLSSVISSTDAASVFSILRSRKLNLKYNTASLLEMESGSNDPTAYTLTLIFISVINGFHDRSKIITLIFSQIFFGLLFGYIFALIAKRFLSKFKFQTSGFEMLFIFAIAIISYAVPNSINGNGYLSTYITGIILGNSNFRGKKNIVHFFDGTTGLMQIIIFFLLGLLSTPSNLLKVIMPAILIMLFITLIARPVATFIILYPFKCPLNQILLISFAGLRGASAIVFAIMAILNTNLGHNIFHITFLIVIMSILFQGSLLHIVSKYLDMIDLSGNVMKTFNDYSEEVDIQFIKFFIPKGHNWINKRLSNIELPPETILVLINRDSEKIVPKGDTIIKEADEFILSAATPEEIKEVQLSELRINENSEYLNKNIYEIPIETGSLIIMIKRGEEIIIPKGDTLINLGDILVLNRISK